MLTLSAAAVVAGPVLAACGTEGTDNQAGGDAGASGSANKVVWSNWPLYLDTAKDDENDHPTLSAFTKRTGIDVEYNEDVNDNDEFFGKISPQLEAGRSTGRDLIVLTDWMAARLIWLGYVQELDKSKIPNAKNRCRTTPTWPSTRAASSRCRGRAA